MSQIEGFSASEADFRTSCAVFFRDKKGGIHFDRKTTFNRRLFNPYGVEVTDVRDFGVDGDFDVETGERFHSNSKRGNGGFFEICRRRAVRRMREYALSDYDLDLFVTLTVSPEKHDRRLYGEIVRHVGQWLDNRVRRNGLKYILVPERHKDGSVHFHGFFNKAACRLVKSGLKRDARGNFREAVEPNRKGKVIYNLADFDIGFTTALRLGNSFDDRRKAVNYCIKYMGKDAEMVGGRWYLHGGKLREPLRVYSNDVLGDLEGFEVAPGTTCKVVFWWDEGAADIVDSFKSVNFGERTWVDFGT